MGQTGQSLSSLGEVSIEFMPEKRQMTWALAVLLYMKEFQMEPLAFSYDTRPTTY